MPKPPITMPDNTALPAGALRSLVAFIHDVYLGAGRPALQTIERGTSALPDEFTVVKKDRVAKLLHGDSTATANWKSVEAVVAFLAGRAYRGQQERVEGSIAEAHRLWQAYDRVKVRNAIGVDLPTDRANPVLRVSTHFARRSFHAHAEAAWQGRGGRRGPRVLQGALAVSTRTFPDDLRRIVFDPEFQDDHVRQLQEFGHLRRGSHSFHTRAHWGENSYAVYGEITGGYGPPDAFIHVEVNDLGVVSVYFREEVDDGTLAELIGWWVHGAVHAALYILQHLGASGFAEGCLLVDRYGIKDATPRNEDRLSSIQSDLSYLGYGRIQHLSVPDFALWDHAAGDPDTWLDKTTYRLTSDLDRAARQALQPQGSYESWPAAANRLHGGRPSKSARRS